MRGATYISSEVELDMVEFRCVLSINVLWVLLDEEIHSDSNGGRERIIRE